MSRGILRGTTPTHIFTCSITMENLRDLRITYKQDGVVLFEKRLADCQITGNKVSVTLTADDTKRFSDKLKYVDGEHRIPPVKIQIGAITETGAKVGCYVINTTVEECLREDGVV